MRQKGFLLVEIIVVVLAIAILTSVVIYFINPSKQLGNTRNTQRRADVNTILNSVYQYYIDSNGVLPETITASPNTICKTGGTCTGLIDLAILTTSEKYLITLPSDPSTSTESSTNYTISKSANNRITVAAPGAEQGSVISVTR